MKLQIYITVETDEWPKGLAECVRNAVADLNLGTVEKVAVTRRQSPSLRRHPSYVTETWDQTLGCRRN